MSLVPVGGGAIVQKSEPPVGAKGEVWYKPADVNERIASFKAPFDQSNYPKHTIPIGDGIVYDQGSGNIRYVDFKTSTNSLIETRTHESYESSQSANYVAYDADDSITVYDKNNILNGSFYICNNLTTGKMALSDEYLWHEGYDGSTFYLEDIQGNGNSNSLSSSYLYEPLSIDNNSNYVYAHDGGVLNRYSVPDLSHQGSVDVDTDMEDVVSDANNVYASDGSSKVVAWDHDSFNQQWSVSLSDPYGIQQNEKYIKCDDHIIDKATGNVETQGVSINGQLTGKDVGININTDSQVATYIAITDNTHFASEYVSDGTNWLKNTNSYSY